MLIREIRYHFTDPQTLMDRSKRISKLLEIERNPKKRRKLINEGFDVLKVIVRKKRDDRELMGYVKEVIDSLIVEHF